VAPTGTLLVGIYSEVAEFVSEKGKDVVDEAGADDLSDLILVLDVLSILADEFNISKLREHVEIVGVFTGETKCD